MKDHLGLYLFFTSSWIHQVSAVNKSTLSFNAQSSSAGFLQAPDADSLVLNGTSSVAVDPAFGFVPIFSGEKLPPVPCLVNSVNAALLLALENYEDLLFETKFRIDSHPQVEIAVLPDEEGGCIPRKFAVWGLNLGIETMMINRNFQSAIFLLSYRGETVASITYKMTGIPGPIGADRALPLFNTTSQASKNANITNVDSFDPTPNSLLRVAFQLTGSVLTIYEIFFLALDMLRDLARFPTRARVIDSTTYIKAGNLNLATRETNPPRTSRNPPYFQAEWLMKALAQTPSYMLDQRSFKEAELVLFIDEIKVGEVSMKRPGTGNGLMQASGDVSTS